MAYEIEQCGEADVVHVVGELDLGEVMSLQSDVVARVEGGRQRVVFDLSRTTFFASDGLAVMLSAREKTKAGGGWVRIVCRSEALLEIFSKTNLNRVFSIYDDLEAALGTGGDA